MKTVRFKFNKLARDKFLEIVRSKGKTPFTRVLEHGEYVHQLKKKLVEEAVEVVDATSQEDLWEELADVLEVIIALANVSKTSLAAIDQLRSKKRDQVGGYERKIYIDYVELDESHPDVEARYRARPDRYEEF